MPMRFSDPIPLDAVEEEPIKLGPTARVQLAPFVKMAAGGLLSALESGRVSVHDIVLIKTCMENIQNCRVVTDPFAGCGDEHEDENFWTLRVLAEKYAGTRGDAGGETFTKAEGFRRPARSRSIAFYVGQKVRDRSEGRTATVTKVEDGAVYVDYGDSTGMATNDHFEPLEAVA